MVASMKYWVCCPLRGRGVGVGVGLAVAVGAVVFVGDGSADAVADGVVSEFDPDVHPVRMMASVTAR